MTIIESILSLMSKHFDSVLSFGGVLISSSILCVTIRSISEQNRPHISFSIETDADPSDMFMVIRNTGNRTAQDITISTTPVLLSFCAKERNIPLIINDEGIVNISGLAPNQVIKSFFDYGLYRDKDNHEIQNITKVNIKYYLKKKKFNESFNLDFSYMDKLAIIKKPDEISKNLQRIADNIESIDLKMK